jgi:multisubunit Na+/H+ antiporter MnhG subunit
VDSLWSNVIGGLIFGAIGFVAFVYGKRQSEWRPMVLGLALMAFPYFVGNPVALYAIGAVLTLGLFFPRA